MPRRRVAVKRDILPDYKYDSKLVARFINGLMYDGKKSIAEDIFYSAMSIVEEKTKKDGLEVFKLALANVKPLLEVKSRRVGGATYQVPVEVRPERRNALGIRWIISFARKRHEKTMVERLSSEILDASSLRGTSVKKKEDTHKMAEANKAFAHYKW